MTDSIVVDASVAIKWLIQENGTSAALALRERYAFVAPDLFSAECANILWKKVRRGELEEGEAHFASRLLERMDVELAPMRPLIAPAVDLALRLDHPTYDCFYLALASARRLRFATADRKLFEAVRRLAGATLSDLCFLFDEP